MEVLTAVAEASHDEDDRRNIMRVLCDCLSESSMHGHCVFDGLLLLEALLRSGSPELMTETAEGLHFDIVQRLLLLEHYGSVDKCVQGRVRTKAAALRKAVMPLLESARLKDGSETDDPLEALSAMLETLSSSASAAKDPSNVCKRRILNDIVAIGHRDDTSSESECDEDTCCATVPSCKPRRVSAVA